MELIKIPNGVKIYYIVIGSILFSMSFVPWPFGLIIQAGVLLTLPFTLKRMAIGIMNMATVKFLCMSCGTKHNKLECPRCGSKLKRAE